jgi:hypothetical protein
MTVTEKPELEESSASSPVGVESLFCKRCKKTPDLRNLDFSKYNEGIITCKTCGYKIKVNK